MVHIHEWITVRRKGKQTGCASSHLAPTNIPGREAVTPSALRSDTVVVSEACSDANNLTNLIPSEPPLVVPPAVNLHDPG